MCDAVHASHQPDVLYLHALHFARVPLKNITRLGGGRGEGGGHSGTTHYCQHFSNTVPITQKNMYCIFWEVTCFPHPSFFLVLIV